MFEGTELWAIVAIATAIGLFGVLATQTLLTLQSADAAGCPLNTPAANASKGRCFRG